MDFLKSNQWLLAESSTEKLIEEVAKRPGLYDKSLKEYSDINQKKKLWKEVCQVVVADWDQLSAAEKAKQGHDVQRKWCNLRTCFRREINTQKNPKFGHASTKRRRYIYFEHLLFLLPHMEKQRTDGKLEVDSSHKNNEDEAAVGPSSSAPFHRLKKRHILQLKQNTLDESPPPQTLKTNENHVADEDTNFALSIVPSLQSLTPDEKLDAKIGILNIFKELRHARHQRMTYEASSSCETLLQNFSPEVHRGTDVMSLHNTSSSRNPDLLEAKIEIISSDSFNDTA